MQITHRQEKSGSRSDRAITLYLACGSDCGRRRCRYTLTNIDADHGDRAVVGLLRHGVLLVFAAPGQLLSLRGAGARPDHPINGHSERVESRAPSASSTRRVAGISADDVNQSDAHREGTSMECCSMTWGVPSFHKDGTNGILRKLRETFLTPIT